MKRGVFISFEGVDGGGKSTQIRRLATALEGRGQKVLLTREPGGAAGAEQIRDLVLTGEPGRWEAITETLLMFAARTDNVARAIKPALAEGRHVLCDRFTDSTYVYQGAGQGLDKQTIRQLECVALGDFRPDLTIILDMPVEAGLQRATARPGKELRFEKFDIAFHRRAREAFLEIARCNPERCKVIDADRDQDSVAAEIWRIVTARLELA
jgi:dTMP kinase